MIRQYLIDLRKKKGLKQEAVALCAGYSRNAINSFERGKYDPKVETLIAIAICLGVDLGLICCFEVEYLSNRKKMLDGVKR